MKKLISIIILTILLQIAFHIPLVSAEEYVDLYDTDHCTSNEMTDVDLSGYKVYEGKPYFFFCFVEGMDARTLKPLIIDGEKSFNYARDKKNVYYNTRILKGLKPGQFEIKTFNNGAFTFLYDVDTTYLDGMDISDSGLDIGSFKALGNYYYRDKDSLYLQTMTDVTPSRIENFTFEKVPSTNPDNFSLGYKRNLEAIYWYGQKIPEVIDAESFQLFHSGYAKDKDNVYKDGKVVYGTDVKSFHEADIEGIDIFIFIDKNKSYYGINAPMKTLRAEHKSSIKSIDQSIKASLQDYKEKYPDYTPQPAIDPNNPPKHPTLDKLKDGITDYKYLNPVLYYSIFITPFVLMFGVVGYVVWRMRKPKGKKRK